MPTEDMGKEATIDAQQKILNDLKLYRLEGITEQDARGLINRIDMFLRASPYMREEEHPPPGMFDIADAKWKITNATVALREKRKKVVQLLEEYEFEKQQQLLLQKNKSQGPLIIVGFGVAALLVAIVVRKVLK